MSAKDASAGALADALLAEFGKGKRSGIVCTGGSTGKNDLIAALHERGMQWQRISETLAAKYGIEIRATPLSRHYNGRCSCPPSR